MGDQWPGSPRAGMAGAREVDRQTFGQAGVGIAHVDLDGTIRRANRAFCRVVGRTVEEITGHDIAAIIHPDDVAKTRAAIEKAIASRESRDTFESRVLRPDDEPVRVEVTASVMPGGVGEPDYLLAFMHEAGRSRAAEAPAREDESRLMAFYEAAFDGICMADSGLIVDVNPRLCELFGYTRDELVGMPCDRLVHPDDLQVLSDSKPIGSPARYERRCVTKDGHVRFVEVLAKQIEFQGRPVRMAAIQDVTSRRRAEEEVARWAHLFKHVSWGVGVSDTTGERIAAVNSAFAAMHGYDARELVGMPILDLYPKSEQEVLRRNSRIAERLGHQTFRSVHVRKDGSEFPVEVSLSVVRDEKGAFLYRGAHVQDITRELEIQRRLEQSQRMESLGVLAGGIAHDFNNILTGVVGYAELVKMAVPAGSREAQDLSELLRAALRGKELVEQILAFSRQAETKKERIDLVGLVREAHKLLRAAIPTTIPVGLSVPDARLPIFADAMQLQQVVMNLGTNALQALRADAGRIDIAVETLEGREDRTITDHTRHCARLIVSDTGHGMDRQTRARAFEPFFTTRGPGGGTGMGLAVVHGIVRDHGGTVEIASEAGKGTRVVVTLPCAEVAPAVVEQVEDASGSGSEHVLLVDDEDHIVAVVSRMVEALGYRVTCFGNPAEVLAYVRSGRPADILLTDQTMPTMTGTALTDAIHAVRPSLPVVLCSGHTDAMTSEQAQALGISALLWKPIQINELGGAIRRVLDGS